MVRSKAEPKAHTRGYATEATTQPLAKRTSKTGKFLAGNRLSFRASNDTIEAPNGVCRAFCSISFHLRAILDPDDPESLPY